MIKLSGRRKNGESVMKLVVGLGNPTIKYDKTRHNVGFEVIDALADKYNIALDTMKHKGMYGKGKIEGQSVILLKPMTFMNLSGVIYDDINLDVGRLRIREKGSAGGHNGMKNIIVHLGTEEFPRIRIGVGMKPPRMDLADYVLSHFSEDEQALMNQGYDKACEALKLLLLDEIPQAMNQYNGK